ncbi:glycosyltransferase [Neiella marina]|uniref:Glycosyltransferase n=1 Tax=Neiella holothuriorum TaxID=2870530 RepID=A0ABS7ELC9_9GAMM|nr:glycosyltransferase [Neiella holothuriorum]MBW8192487.1 glycosyltransferase [Neiella holothuriorum]
MVATTATPHDSSTTWAAQPQLDVSVIVPIYNAEQWLNESLNSLLAQTYRSLEVILVVDAATDNSLAICQRYVAVAPHRFRVISLPCNQGISAARNIGIAAARGKYIGFADADDWVHPQMYQSLVECLAQQQGRWARCNMRSFDSLRTTSVSMPLTQHYEDTFVTNKLFEAAALNRLGINFYPDVIFEDEAFVYLVRMLEGPAAECQFDGYWYRLNPDGACRDPAKNRFNLLDKQAMLCRFVADAERRELLPEHSDLLLECLTNHALSALYYPVKHADRCAFFLFIEALIHRYKLLPGNQLQPHHQRSYAISRFFRFIKAPLSLWPLASWCRLRARFNIFTVAQ